MGNKDTKQMISPNTKHVQEATLLAPNHQWEPNQMTLGVTEEADQAIPHNSYILWLLFEGIT